MRRTITVVVAVTLLAATTSTALAANVKGTRGPDVLIGTEQADTIRGKGGDDSIDARGGADKLFGGSGNDDLAGGTGRDFIFGGTGRDTASTQDGEADRIICGRGVDKAFIDALDETTGCEEVVISIEAPGSPGTT